jgi:hypothetical protein
MQRKISFVVLAAMIVSAIVLARPSFAVEATTRPSTTQPAAK